jgi:MFS transporter, DHA2 family, multidrug resistance protein
MPAGRSLTPGRRFLAGMVLAVSNFMIVLDLTIANVSVPHIAGDLGITLAQGTWIITSYAVAEAVCVPLTGWLAARFGVVRMFILAMIGFGLFSLLCGMSVTLGMLVACRIGQGICGAPVMPMSQTLMLRVFPPDKRGAAIGVWAMTTLLGPAMGPIIGGWISDSFTWHWIFLLNVPIAMLCVFFAWTLLREVETETVRLPIDKVGMILLVFWIGCLQLMLDLGRDHAWFDDWRIVALGIGAGVGFLVFLIWELTERHPAVDLRIFRHRGFTFGVLTLALSFGAYFASIVVVPQWLQTSLGYTATDAGILNAMSAMSAIVVAPIAAKLMDRMDARIMISASVAWLGLMTLVRAGWTSGIDFWAMAVPQILQGFALPFFIVPLTALSLGAVPPDETPGAAGLQNFVRTMAIAIATSLALTVWGDAQRMAQTDVAGSLNPADTLDKLNRLGLDLEQGRRVIAGVAGNEATMLAVNHTVYVTVVVLFVAAAIVWFSPRPGSSADMGRLH